MCIKSALKQMSREKLRIICAVVHDFRSIDILCLKIFMPNWRKQKKILSFL
jgi:hypothetical protein